MTSGKGGEGAAVRAVKGMNDVLPQAAEAFLDTAVWAFIHDTSRRVLEGYGYRHVYLPIVEETALFARGIGAGTDIVQKEMYSFTDRGDRQLTLRPEGTASAARAYVQHNLSNTQPVQRWWYSGPMFRAERPQKGRYRQFYQIGAELLGTDAPAADAELITCLWHLCGELGLAGTGGARETTGITPRINSLGDRPSREAYRDALRQFLLSHRDSLCDSCKERFATNPLRVLDCKRGECLVQEAPDIKDSLTEASASHFDAVQELLVASGVPIKRDRRLVRGLDYYTGTLFEFTTTSLGAQDAILGGGRYDDLVEALGGPSTPAIGFAAGVERLALLLCDQPRFRAARTGAHLYVIPMAGQEAAAATLAAAVRSQGSWRVEVDVAGGRLKQQMRRADRSGARAVLVVGEDEIAAGHGKLKILDLSSETATELSGPAIAEVLAKNLAPVPE